MDTVTLEAVHSVLPPWVWTVFGFLLGIGFTAIIVQIISRTRAKTFQQDLERQIEGAKREAENIIKSAQIDAAAESI